MADVAVRVDSGNAYVDLPSRQSIQALSANFAIKAISVVEATLDFPSIATFAVDELTVTVAGARANDLVMLGPPSGLDSPIIIFGFVSADDTVTVRAANMSGGSVDMASSTYSIGVFHRS